ncbi:hypothetical protein RUM44_008069 [Polyplax serrata]|uniref:Exosome complex component RRP45 n=1 Tax=Polyplax serrata TaxID=468196 RepID=A0ABR1B7P8_POLSC
MKETILSNCERNFILKAASELKRLDGRKLEEFRNLKVLFGSDWGLCYVALGESKVLTQVTCEIQEPKATKPNEGLLFINVELSSMASANFEQGRSSNLSVHINRLLEKCIKDSRAVDLESLCIVAEDKVWVLRVDVNILNHDGSLVDCASISALAALGHFKRPDVTTDGEEIKVHSVAERDPIPITLHHYPVCVSFALLNDSENIFADPTAIEERVADAGLTFGINAYQEICCLHLGGTALIKPKLILASSVKAANRAKEVVKIINDALQKDAETRQSKEGIGFTHAFEWNRVTAMSEGRLQVQLSKFNINDIPEVTDHKIQEKEQSFDIINLGDNCAELNIKSSKEESEYSVLSKGNKNIDSLFQKEKSYGEGGLPTWQNELKEPQLLNATKSEPEPLAHELPITVQTKQVHTIDLSDEEEEVVVLNMLDPNDAQNKMSKKKKFTPKKETTQSVCQKSRTRRKNRNKK